MRLVAAGWLLLGGIVGCVPPEAAVEDEARFGGVAIAGAAPHGAVEVRPAAVDSFAVYLDETMRIEVVWAEGQPPRAEVTTAHLSFAADATELAFHSRDETYLWQGRVWVPPNHQIERVRLRDGRLRGDLPVLGGMDSELRAEGLVWSASWLAPGPPPSPEEAAQAATLAVVAAGPRVPPLRRPADGLTAHARAERLVLHAAPGDARHFTLMGLDPDERFEVGESDGRFTELRWERDDFAFIAWADTRDLRFSEELGGGGWMVGGGIACGFAPRVRPSEKAVLPVGTIIHAAPAAGPWARVHAPVEVALVPSDVPGWFEVQEIVADLEPHGHMFVNIAR